MMRLNGIFPVYKPVGITSSQHLELIKSKLQSDFTNNIPIKMGHGGTLDKSASGILVVGVNEACSTLPAFLGGTKVYRTTVILGTSTDTYNADGRITEQKSIEHVSHPMIESTLKKFVGKILQKPPAYSALKQNGKRLSDLVREGVEVDPKARLVESYKITIVNFNPPKLQLLLACGSGFYVRSLAHDLGQEMNCCGHVSDLERIEQGPFKELHCLPDTQWSALQIQQWIHKWQPMVAQYIQKQMKKYRKKPKLWEP